MMKKLSILFVLWLPVLIIGARTWPPETGGVGGVVEDATTSTSGIVTFAANREDVALKAVQASDTRLDPFVGSGAGHRSGLVPDPGGSADTVAFLREDGEWAVPTELLDPGMELTDEEARALSIGVSTEDWIVLDTRAATERINAWRPLYIMDDTSSTGKDRVGGTPYTSVAQSSAILGTNETQTPQYFSTGSFTFPANRFRAGTTIMFDGWGIHDVGGASGATGQSVMGFGCGTSGLLQSQTIDPADNDRFHIFGRLIILSTGAPGTLTGTAHMHTTGVPTNAQITQMGTGSGTTMTANIDTTTTQQCGIYVINAVGKADTESAILSGFTMQIVDVPS